MRAQKMAKREQHAKYKVVKGLTAAEAECKSRPCMRRVSTIDALRSLNTVSESLPSSAPQASAKAEKP